MAAENEELTIVMGIAFDWAKHRVVGLCNTEVALRSGQWVQQAAIDRMLVAKGVLRLDLMPLFRLQKVKHFNFADVGRTAQFEKVAILNDDKTGCTCSFSQAW